MAVEDRMRRPIACGGSGIGSGSSRITKGSCLANLIGGEGKP